jgi:hypothetical protein
MSLLLTGSLVRIFSISGLTFLLTAVGWSFGYSAVTTCSSSNMLCPEKLDGWYRSLQNGSFTNLKMWC